MTHLELIYTLSTVERGIHLEYITFRRYSLFPWELSGSTLLKEVSRSICVIMGVLENIMDTGTIDLDLVLYATSRAITVSRAHGW
jgi:hypothetical protein